MAYYIELENNKLVEVNEGDDVTSILGIEKYEPPIPTHMAGEVFNAHGYTVNYDIENFKKFPDVLVEGEEVVMTEKLHGTWCCFGYHPDVEHPIVTSKGLSGKGLAFKFNEANATNLYIKALEQTELDGDDVVTRARRKNIFADGTPFYILGEVFGQGIQDAGWYDADRKHFRVFDIYVGEPGKGGYVDYETMKNICFQLALQVVPQIYVGPFSKEKMLEVTDGKTTFGKAGNIREGVVVKPTVERNHPELGRVVLKSVSEKYLLRKNGSEYT